jgi:hypothetical protein
MSAEPARGPPNISGMCSLKARCPFSRPTTPHAQHCRLNGPGADAAPAPRREQVDNLGYSATQEDVQEAVRGSPRAGQQP